jgi:type II secretory pathway predicted ATPase ExeA
MSKRALSRRWKNTKSTLYHVSSNRSLKQRLCVSAHLAALSREQSYLYFDHQLAMAKSNVKIFMDNAIETIITAAKGIPRIINTVALKAMNDAASNKMTIVDQEGVMRVLGELGSWG